VSVAYFVCIDTAAVRAMEPGRRALKKRHSSHWTILSVIALLVACQPATVQLESPTTTPAAAITTTSTPTPQPTHTPTPPHLHTPTLPHTPTPESPHLLALPYTPIEDPAAGRIRGQLFFPSDFIPPLAVYAVATDGSHFYRVDTQLVPPVGVGVGVTQEPSVDPTYEIPRVAPGTYYVYGFRASLPSTAGNEGGPRPPLGGVYSYLAACEAGHVPEPPEDCWEDPQHDPVPVEVRAGQTVEEVNLYDWYRSSPLPVPDDTGDWPVYTNEQLAYRVRYPPHWEVWSEREGETTFGPTHPFLFSPPLRGEGLGEESGEAYASIRVVNGDPEELADALITSLPPGEVAFRDWLPFAGRESLYLVLDLPEGRFAWWFVPRYELVYVVHAVTDSGLGSFDQMLETFEFNDQ